MNKKLYSGNCSPNSLRVRAVAFELGIDLDISEVDLRAGDHRSESYLAMNPNAKVPVLQDGDFVLWESRAICSYLAGQQPDAGLYPTGLKTRATIDQWSWWPAIHLGGVMQKRAFELLLKEKLGMAPADTSVVAAERKNVEKCLSVLETGLAGKDWIVGAISLADFHLASTFMYRKPAGISPEALPSVTSCGVAPSNRDAVFGATLRHICALLIECVCISVCANCS